MAKRIVFIHGNQSTHWSFAFAPWLKTEVEKLGFATFFETMPDSIIARAEYWLPFLKDHVKAGENDILVGWSSGGTATMRYTETHKIYGSILIGPSYTDLNDPLEKQSGYYDKPWDWESIKKNQGKIALVYGDDDPYISQSEFEFIAEKLNPTVIKIPGGKHFIESAEIPQVLEYIKKTYKP